MERGTPKPAHLTWVNIAVGLLFLLLDAFLSWYFALGLSTSLLVAAARCVVQLTIMVDARNSSRDRFLMLPRVSSFNACSRRIHLGQLQA